MFGLGMGEILLIAVVALLVLGPEKLPGAAKSIGKGIRDLRKQTKDLQDSIEQDTQLGDAMRELKGALRDEPVPPKRLPPNKDGARGQRSAPAIAPATGAEPRPPRGGEREPDEEPPGPAAEEAPNEPGPAPAGPARSKPAGGAPGTSDVNREADGEAAPRQGPVERDGSAHG